NSGSVALTFKDFSNGLLGGVQPDPGAVFNGTAEADAVRITAGSETCPSCRTRGRGGRNLSEIHPVTGHLIKMGCFIAYRSVTGDIAVSHVVKINNNDIGARLFFS